MNSKANAELEQLRAYLSDKGVDTQSLGVWTVAANELALGECSVKSPDAPGPFQATIANPKRFYRLTQVGPGGMSINYMIGDWDLIDQGFLDVNASAMYYLRHQSIQAQIDTLNLYKQYFERRAAARVLEAGLVTPSSSIIRPNLR